MCCFGILHRVENSLGLLRVLRGRTVDGRTVLVETYGVGPEDRNGPAIRVSEPAEVYARDEFVYSGFGAAGLQRIARIVGSRASSRSSMWRSTSHPPIIGRLVAYKLPDGVLNSLFTTTTISGRSCRSRFVELSGSSSEPIRARSDWRFGAARLLSC